MYTELGIVLLLILIIVLIYIYYLKSSSNIFFNNIYLDNNGTTQMCDKALSYYKTGSGYGNASSTYATDAQELMNMNELLIKSWIQSDYRIIYTSGATESNNTIIKSLSKQLSKQLSNLPHVILSSYEHKSNIECAKILEKEGQITLSLVDPSIYGFINPQDVANIVNANTILVSIMHINNEMGTINNIKNICNACKNINPNLYFHTDAVQSFGKYSIPMHDWNIDSMSISYHKIYGPQGVGLLIVNQRTFNKIKLHPLINGSQNNGTRGGTINISGISASYAALTHTIHNRVSKNIHLYNMKQFIVDHLSNKYNIGDYINYVGKSDNYTVTKYNQSDNEIIFLGDDPRLTDMSPNTLLISIIKYGIIQHHFCNVQLRSDLQDHNIIISIGSTCNSQSFEPSHVLHVIRAPYIIRCGVIRISLGDNNTMREIKKFCQILSNCIELQNH